MNKVWRWQPEDRKSTTHAFYGEWLEVDLWSKVEKSRSEYWRPCIVGSYWTMRRSGVSKHQARHIVVQMLEGPCATVTAHRRELVTA